MLAETKLPVLATSLIKVDVIACHRTQLGMSCEECKTEHQLTIPLSGVNLKHVAGRSLVVSPARVTLSNRGETYRISHPHGSGETALNIVLGDDVLLPMLCQRNPGTEDRPGSPFVESQIPIDSKLHSVAQLIAVAGRSAKVSQLELEETVIVLADRILCASKVRVVSPAVTPREREIAREAQAVIANRYRLPITLQEIATSIDISVYHLCRVFRRVTAVTLWFEIQQLRIRAAVRMLADGDRDLTAIAMSLGFAHHSHFTAAFRRTIGLTPSAAVRLLERGSVRQVRELLQH